MERIEKDKYPSSEVEISHAGYSLKIDLKGAYLMSLSKDGELILYGAEIDGKKRATHVCVPNFGPDASGQLDQHGFGRNINWNLTTKTETDSESLIILETKINDGDYAGLDMYMSYMVDGNTGSFGMQLTCQNTSDQPMRLAPGFHPYFALPVNTESVAVNQVMYDMHDLNDAKFTNSDNGATHITLGKRQIIMLSNEMPIVAVWSAHPDKYVCVEPTVAGASFEKSVQPDSSEMLEPHQTRSYSLTINMPDSD